MRELQLQPWTGVRYAGALGLESNAPPRGVGPAHSSGFEGVSVDAAPEGHRFPNDTVAGQTFGRYRILSVIQRGGMGELFLAEVAEGAGRGQKVVLKRLLADFLDDESYEGMFRSEARVMSRLAHPNIVRVFDVPVVDGKQCLAMEFVPGRNLAQILKRCRSMGLLPPPQIALAIIDNVLEGLEYAHGSLLEDGRPMELVHRDVTPGNILVSFQGAVKITDFGIAKSKMSIVSTSVGVVKGTTRYLSPEQIRGLVVSPVSDVFSAGIVLIELLSGQCIFDRGSVPPTLFAIIKDEREAVSRLLPFEAPLLADVLERAIANRPEDRPTSARALRIALREAAQSMGPPVGATGIAAFLQALFPENKSLFTMADGAASPRIDSREIEYLFAPEDPTREQSMADARPLDMALRENVSGARPLVAGDFESPNPPAAPPPLRDRLQAKGVVLGAVRPHAGDVRVLSITVPVDHGDIERIETDPDALRVDSSVGGSLIDAVEAASAELDAVESPRVAADVESPVVLPAPPRASSGKAPPPMPEAPQSRARELSILAVGLMVGVLLATLLPVSAPSSLPISPIAPTVEPALKVPAEELEAVAEPALAAESEPDALAEDTPDALPDGAVVVEDPAPEDVSIEAAPAPRDPYGHIDIVSPLGARVRIDGVSLSRRVPIYGFNVEPGKRTVVVTKGRFERTTHLRVEAGQHWDLSGDRARALRVEDGAAQ